MYFDPERLWHTRLRANCPVGVNCTTSPNIKTVAYFYSIIRTDPNTHSPTHKHTHIYIHSNYRGKAIRLFACDIWREILSNALLPLIGWREQGQVACA